MPYSAGGKRLLAIAESLGFTFVRRSRSGRHVLLRHAASNTLACLPLAVSESGRNFDNYRLALERIAGARTYTSEPMRTIGDKRPTGEARERTLRIAARLDNAERERAAARLERRNQQLRFYERMMTT